MTVSVIMRVSVIVPLWNSERTIGRTIECLLQQTLAPAEIIIIDDGSTDRSREVLQRFEDWIIVVTRTNGGPASARNVGLRLASSELIAFTDSDCYPEPGWLAALVSGFDNPAVGGVGGVVRGADPNLCGEYIDLIRLLDPAIDQSGEIGYLITANAAFRREVLFEAGLFDEGFRLPGGEEADLGWRIRRLGYHLRFAPEAVVRHEHRRSMIALLRTLANYGEGAARIATLRPPESGDPGMTHPWPTLLRRIVAVRSLLRNIAGYRAFGLKRAIYFAWLEHWREPAFLWGFIRGKSQRHHPLP